VSVIRWEDPPPPHSTHNPVALSHELIAVQLKRRPNEWGVVAEAHSNTGLADRIKSGKFRQYQPAGSFEAVSRHINGVFTIYARYIGEPS
jgi:hypothetical protein